MTKESKLMNERIAQSPLATYTAHLQRGALAYQYDKERDHAVFFPRVIPENGSVEWRVSQGRGTVYSSTVVFPRGAAPYNVALIDLDEGFRMMSRVECPDPMQVTIGQRVSARIVRAEGEELPLVVFDRVDA
ncbi:OB-fold domain-containing protein [Verticiella sediminum]|uniref:OB-fold domain-containing protein n=1 Tax=Verticiella sediminum TaxID=1247510 RepID=A0A556AKM9_9BURK|nr:OB-fold domain-containing protein [Verticiella sediminum]TSH93430.1 OB-fold domain-containing protein [Verticiella sediminum]